MIETRDRRPRKLRIVDCGLWIFGAILFLLTSPVDADVVYFETGELVQGFVVEEHRDRVVISTEAGEQEILRDQIDEIFYHDPERNYLYLGNEALRRNEFGLARGFFAKAIQLAPEMTEAHDALGLLEDFQRKFMLPRNPEAASLQLFLERRWGLVLESENGWLTVKNVRENSLAWKVGLVVGDQLVAVWGESLKFLSVEQAAELLLGSAGSYVKLTIGRQTFLGRTEPQMGVSIDILHRGLTVLTVKPQSPAALSGLQEGDQVVSIQDISTRYMPISKARRMIQEGENSEKGALLFIHRDLMIQRS